jgi:hypothetical protein
MDWQFKVGIGLCLVFGFLQFTGLGRMPNWVTWPGISIGFLFIIWGLLPNHQKIPVGPAILFIVCIAGIAGSVAWYKLFLPAAEENQFHSKLILSIKRINIVDSKSKLTMDTSFQNDSTKDFIIDTIIMKIPGNDKLRALDKEDTILNNFNGKAMVEIISAHDVFGRKTELVSGHGLGAEKIGLPKIIKPNELFPIQVSIQFNVKKFIENQKLANITNIPIGLEVQLIDYKGQTKNFLIYPVAQLNIEHDNRMESIVYMAPITFEIDIETGHVSQISVESKIIRNIVLTPINGAVNIPAPPYPSDEIDFKIE